MVLNGSTISTNKTNIPHLRESHRQWVEEILKNGSIKREAKWSESIDVGDKEFLSEVKAKLGARAIGRKILEVDDNENYELCESQTPYNPLFSLKRVL
jgi:putative transposase